MSARTQVLIAVEDLPGHQAAHAGFAAGAEHPEGRVRRLSMDKMRGAAMGYPVMQDDRNRMRP